MVKNQYAHKKASKLRGVPWELIALVLLLLGLVVFAVVYGQLLNSVSI